MKNKLILLVVSLAVVALLAVATVFYEDLSTQYSAEALVSTQNEQTEQQEESLEDPTPAPDFTVEDLNGNPVKLSDFLGKPVVINFWASWCSACKSGMPAFQQAWETYGDQVEFLMINLTDNNQETLNSAKEFLAGTDYTWPVYFDTQLSAAMAYGVRGIPVSYFIDAQGSLIAGANSALDYETLQYGISLILEE